jgi:hypothetical protein
MKTTIAVCSAAIMLFAVTFRAGADIVAGPITNPANGHDYYLLTPNTWTASEAEAENLGGTLVVINNAAEEEWVFSKFGAYGGTNRNLWIGLHRQWQGGPFAWVTDEKLDYVNWHEGQPDNAGGVENCVHIWARSSDNPNSWNDVSDSHSGSSGNDTPYGVVEVPGKSKEKSLTEQEKSLIGTWYERGNVNHPCWIAGTENMLFEIYDRRASRLIYTTEGLLFVVNSQEGIHGEIVKDRILWGNGTWWSRKPVEYKTREISSDKSAPKLPSGGMTDETAK